MQETAFSRFAGTTSMTWARWRIGLAALLFAPLLGGCKSLLAPKGPPADPLLALRKPVESKAEAGPPLTVVYSEPQAPADPFHRENRPAIADLPPRRVPGTLTNRTIDPDLRRRD